MISNRHNTQIGPRAASIRDPNESRPKPADVPVVTRTTGTDADSTGSVQISVIGRVAAGGPIDSLQQDLGEIPVARRILHGRGGFALEVDGNSMIEAGIYDGDYVIVREQPMAENGDIVVARIGSECTLKRFYIEEDCVRLEPANSEMEPIRVRAGEFGIQGKVVGVMRARRA